jgi:amidase
VKLPFDCWEVGLTTWKLYFQTGAAEHKAAIAESGEIMIPSLRFHLDTYDIKPLTVTELFALNTKQAVYKAQMASFWKSAAEASPTNLPLDAIICPVHPSAGYPHDFKCYWGYTSLFNILDYPSITLPIKDLKISKATDPKDSTYKPLKNPFDQNTYDMCK